MPAQNSGKPVKKKYEALHFLWFITVNVNKQKEIKKEAELMEQKRKLIRRIAVFLVIVVIFGSVGRYNCKRAEAENNIVLPVDTGKKKLICVLQQIWLIAKKEIL